MDPSGAASRNVPAGKQPVNNRTVGFVVAPIALAMLPLLILVVSALRDDFTFYFTWIEDELGPIEIGTILFSLAGFVVALGNFRHRANCPHRWFGAWLLLFAAGFFYIAGEEASWGQHFFGWESPEFFAEANRQGETNLHNLWKPLDRLPKSIIGIGIVLSGVVWPFFRRRMSKLCSGWFGWIWPTQAVVVSAWCFFVVWIIDRVLANSKLDVVNGGIVDLTELLEMLSAYFLLVYIWAIGDRLRKSEPVSQG